MSYRRNWWWCHYLHRSQWVASRTLCQTSTDLKVLSLHALCLSHGLRPKPDIFRWKTSTCVAHPIQWVHWLQAVPSSCQSCVQLNIASCCCKELQHCCCYWCQNSGWLRLPSLLTAIYTAASRLCLHTPWSETICCLRSQSCPHTCRCSCDALSS